MKNPWTFKSVWRLASALVLAAFCLAGCGTGPLHGLLYTRVKLPLTRDLNNTPAALSTSGSGRIAQVREPVSGFGLSAQFDSNAIGETARRHGISKVHYADKEIYSILGIWTTTTIIIYGERSPGAPPPDTASAAPGVGVSPGDATP